MAIAGTTRLSRSALMITGVALSALLLTACGSSTPNAPSATSTPTTSAVASSAAASAAIGASSGADGKTVTLSGTIEAGVESGCFVLVDSGGAVLANLIDLDTGAAPAGALVEVTGTFEEDMMTICQQGKPFSVTAVELRN